MLRKILFWSKFNVSDERSANTMLQVILNIIYRGGAMLCSFLMVPLTLNYLNPSNYGVWLTLNSIVGWFLFFDVGLGNGLKNRLSQSFAEGDIKSARAYISTTYMLLGGLLIVVLILYALAMPFIDWSKILNSGETDSNLNWIAFVTVFCFCGRLLVDLIFSVLAADQKTSHVSLIAFIASALMILAVFVASRVTEASLFIVAVVVSGIPLLVSLVSNIYLYATRYKSISPTIDSVDIKGGKKVLNLGLRFFMIQLALLVIYSTDNLIITQLYGPEAVTDYNVVYKYFSVFTVIWNIALTPYWPAFGNAYFSQDFGWISQTMGKLRKWWFALMGGMVLMLIISPWVYRLWLGRELGASFMLSACMALFVLVATLSSLYVVFINGTGKIQLQFYGSILVATINIPLSITLAEALNLGPAGVVLGNCLSLSSGPILNYIQYRKIVTRTDTGIWSK